MSSSEQRQPAIRDEDGRRQRSPLAAVRRVPRKDRRAELVCDRGGQPAHLLAVVYPRAVPADALRVNTGRSSVGLGADFTVVCPCGLRHEVDGGRLRSAVAGGDAHRLTVVRVSDVRAGT